MPELIADTPPPNLVTDGAVSSLTDGTGVSRLLGSKIIKDLVLDFLLSAPIALGASALGIVDLSSAIAAPAVVILATGDALIRVLYRAGLRWAQTPA